MSISYGESEADDGATQNAYINSLYQQAVSEGVSVFVAAGDEGAASSDAGESTASDGIGISGFTSTPYNVSMGGTDFGDTYANDEQHLLERLERRDLRFGHVLHSGNSVERFMRQRADLSNYAGYSTTYGSNGFCNSSTGEEYFQVVVGGSGGPSGCATGTASNGGVVSGSCKGYAKPSWQSVPGNPSDGVRDTPDLSLFAAERRVGSLLRDLLFRSSQGPLRCAMHGSAEHLGRFWRNVVRLAHHGGNPDR